MWKARSDFCGVTCFTDLFYHAVESDGVFGNGTDRWSVLWYWHRDCRICTGADRDYGNSVSALYTPGCVGITFDTGSIFFWCAVSDPIGYGLTRTPSSAISASFGVILYYFMELVSDNASVLTGADKEEKIQNLQFLSDGLMKNQEMMVTIIAFVTVLVIVYVVRRLEVEYAWHIAVFGGGIAYMIIMAAGGIFLEATIPVVPLVAGTMVSVFVGEILEFFFFHVDYKRTERLQFEDDEYYYYVKAVPKIKDMKKQWTETGRSTGGYYCYKKPGKGVNQWEML